MRYDSHDPGPSTPPATPDALRRRRPESLIPPRNAPSAVAALSLAVSASSSAALIADPTNRALVTLACALLAWLVGYFTPPPRRSFRRGDP